jgi:hypothetical protein
MTNKQLLKKLENACVVCRDCGLKYGVYSVGCSSVWEGVCNVCDEKKPVTETRDYAYLMTGIRKLLKEDIKEQSKAVADYMITQEPTAANHPITPPSELVSKWANMFEFHSDAEVFTEVARWGSDTELEACCEVMRVNGDYVSGGVLRAIRRPKPPSLKEQALDELTSAERLYPADWSTIRKALEALPND